MACWIARYDAVCLTPAGAPNCACSLSTTKIAKTRGCFRLGGWASSCSRIYALISCTRALALSCDAGPCSALCTTPRARIMYNITTPYRTPNKPPLPNGRVGCVQRHRILQSTWFVCCCCCRCMVKSAHTHTPTRCNQTLRLADSQKPSRRQPTAVAADASSWP